MDRDLAQRALLAELSAENDWRRNRQIALQAERMKLAEEVAVLNARLAVALKPAADPAKEA